MRSTRLIFMQSERVPTIPILLSSGLPIECLQLTLYGRSSTYECLQLTLYGRSSTYDCLQLTLYGRSFTYECLQLTLYGRSPTYECLQLTLCGRSSTYDALWPDVLNDLVSVMMVSVMMVSVMMVYFNILAYKLHKVGSRLVAALTRQRVAALTRQRVAALTRQRVEAPSPRSPPPNVSLVFFSFCVHSIYICMAVPGIRCPRDGSRLEYVALRWRYLEFVAPVIAVPEICWPCDGCTMSVVLGQMVVR
ncbi:hypothetical protein Btru_017405 [Bulinus truncatus]|nr:hypothetical protein Btru_017405 [Bulinus truncatus]